MNQVVPTQHPAVVLRSNYNHLRTLFAVAMLAVAGLTAAVVILASQREETITPRVESPAVAVPRSIGTVNGPDEAKRGLAASTAAAGIGTVNGPDETLRGLSAAGAVSHSTPTVNGPDETLRGLSASGAVSHSTPTVNGPDETLRGLAASGAASQNGQQQHRPTGRKEPAFR